LKFVPTKKVRQQIFVHPSLFGVLLFLDPGWVKIRIRDKHPGSGSATLLVTHVSSRSGNHPIFRVAQAAAA
jgi:hypothetical protein